MIREPQARTNRKSSEQAIYRKSQRHLRGEDTNGLQTQNQTTPGSSQEEQRLK